MDEETHSEGALTGALAERPADPIGFGLSRDLWLVVLGIFLNYLGYGAVLPFEIIFLHDVRGFGLGMAGLVVGLITGAAVMVSPLAGPLIDRFGARRIATAGGIALAAGYAGLAFARHPGQALAAALLAGTGNGALNPSQSTLLAVLAPPGLRHRVTAVSRVASNAGIGFGSFLGGLVAGHGLTGFVALFLANAVTYLAYVGVLLAVVRGDARPERTAGGYAAVARDRPFLHLALTNVAIIGVGWGVFTWLVPPYARGQLGLSTQRIGMMMLANAVTVVVAQVPVARFAERRRRMLMMALGAAHFAAACVLVVAARAAGSLAFPVLVLAAVLVGAGECFHTTVLMPLVADLAPASLRGRYMAAIGLSWWAGLALAPTLGSQALGVSPGAAFLGAAAVSGAAAASVMLLERSLPAGARRTPAPERGARG